MTRAFLLGQSSGAQCLLQEGGWTKASVQEEACGDSRHRGKASPLRRAACPTCCTTRIFAFGPQARVRWKMSWQCLHTSSLHLSRPGHAHAAHFLWTQRSRASPRRQIRPGPADVVFLGVRPFVCRGDFQIRHTANPQAAHSLDELSLLFSVLQRGNYAR